MNSGYPVAIISNQHDGISFVKNRKVRTAYNNALAEQGIGPELDRLIEHDPRFTASLEQYHNDLDANVQVENPVGHYYHLKMINNVVNRAKDAAWLQISDRPDVKEMVEKKRNAALDARLNLANTSQQPTLQTMYK